MSDPENRNPEQSTLDRRAVLGFAAAVTGGAFLASRIGKNDSTDPDPADDTTEPTPSRNVIADREEIVSDDGFDIHIGPVHVFAPAGVAAEGTPLRLAITEHVVPSDDAEYIAALGNGIEITLDDGVQPEQPITIEMDLSEWSDLTADISDEAPLLMVSHSDISEEPLFDSVFWDPQTQTATVVIEHLSVFGFLKIDVKQMLTDFLEGLLSLQHPRPACAYEPYSITEGTYNVRSVVGDTMWPCVRTDEGALVLDLHSNSVLPWAVTTSPRVSGTVTGDFFDASPAIGFAYQEMHRLLGVQRSIVMSGKTTSFRFTGVGQIPAINVEIDRIFFVAAVAISVVSAILERLQLKSLAKLLLDSVGALECIAQTINTTYRESAQEVAQNGFITALKCISEWLSDASKASGRFFAATITSIVSLLVSAASSLAGVVVLFLSNATGSFSIHIDHEGQTSATSGSDVITGTMPMADGNPARTGEMPGPMPQLNQPIAVKWKFPIGVPTGARPVIQDGVVVISSGDKNIYAINADTGAERWRHAQADHYVYTATMDNGRVFFGQRTTLYVNHLCALDIQTGATKWMYEVPLNGNSLVVVVDGVVYGTGQDGSMYALDAATGREVWSRSVGEFLGRTPAIADGLLYVGHNNTLLAIDTLTGSTRWQYPMENDLTTPTVVGNLVYYRSLNTAIHAINKSTGAKIWDFHSSGPLQGQVVSDGITYIANNELQLIALDALAGSELWRVDGIRGLPTVVNGVAYVTDVDNAFCAIAPDSGELLGRVRFAIPLNGRTYVDGIIYGMDEDGNLIAAGNVRPSVLLADVIVRGAPSATSIERGSANAGAEILSIGDRDWRSGQEWVEVTIGGVTGWIPLDAIDTATLPPEGKIEYVYVPE